MSIPELRKRLFTCDDEAEPVERKKAALSEALSEKVLTAYKSTLKEGDPNASLTVAAHGGSGFTLLGRVPVRCIEHYAEDQNLDIVLKWIPKKGAKDEKACNALAEFFGLKVPVMESVSEKTAKLFESPTKERKAAFTPEPFDLIAMNRISGMNLFQLCTTKSLMSINQTSWNAMMHEFGKASIFDLFIGNFDRFIRFSRDKKTGFRLVEKPKANPGNLLIELSPEKKNVRKVAFIDNSSLVPPTYKGPPEDFSSYDMGGIFGDAPRFSSTPRAAKSTDQDEELVEALAIFFEDMIQKIDPDLAGGFRLVELHPEDAALMSPQKQALPSNELSQHIIAALINAIEDMDETTEEEVETVKERLAAAEEHLQNGIREGLQILKDDQFQIDVKRIAEAGSRNLQELITLNLATLHNLITRDSPLSAASTHLFSPGSRGGKSPVQKLDFE